MSAEKLANRYSSAFFDDAVANQKLEKVKQDVNLIAQTITVSKDFDNFIKNPIIETSKKQSVIQELFASKLDTVTMNFLKLLIVNRREMYLPLILKKFVNKYNDVNGITEVNVSVAAELDAATQNKIEDFIKKQSGKPNVKINQKVDASILGGFVIDFGDKILDNSVKYKLNKIRQELLA
jgi:F-type H+-transporting ATPase subunit delta